MNIEIGGRTEALDEGHGARVGLGPILSGLLDQERGDDPISALVPRPRHHLISVSWRARTQRCVARQDHSEPARACHRRLVRFSARAGCAGAYELGQAAQTGVRHRHRTLHRLWRHPQDHRRNRRPARDCPNSRPSGPAQTGEGPCLPSSSGAAARTGAPVRSLPSGLMLKRSLVLPQRRGPGSAVARPNVQAASNSADASAEQSPQPNTIAKPRRLLSGD